MSQGKIGVLLINLGTPDSFHLNDVYRYLIEFLTDERVIDLSWLRRQLLVRGVIVPNRYRQSADSYRKIWTKEGSPLMIHGLKLQELLQEKLGEEFIVKLAMRYQNPSIPNVIEQLQSLSVKKIVVLPLFPQYASATTGSVHQKVMEAISPYIIIPEMVFVHSYPHQPQMIQAFSERARSMDIENYDHILFSYHGLPERQVLKADRSGCCLKQKNCCQVYSNQNSFCYVAQCHATTSAIAAQLSLTEDRYSICFQSRLGKEPWLQPYASETISKLAHQGKKRVLVFCPSFVCDCLETLYEIGVEYEAEFQKEGGEKLDLVPGLNDHPEWVAGLETIVRKHAH